MGLIHEKFQKSRDNATLMRDIFKKIMIQVQFQCLGPSHELRRTVD